MSSVNITRSDTRQNLDHKSRRRALLTLLDTLDELSNQELDHVDETEGPSIDEQVQTKGAEAFESFQRRMQQLDKELQILGNSLQQLAFSDGILSSCFHLRQRLIQVLFLFRENAADLFPSKVQPEQRELNLHEVKNNIRRHQIRRRQENASPNVMRSILQDDFTPECLPGELNLLARDVSTFSERLNEFPEFTDEALNASILAFEGDLKYRASCMMEFEGQFRYPSVERYVHDLSDELGDHIESITSALGVLAEAAIVKVRMAQKRDAINISQFSAVSTFFSAVTATTIQLSFDKVDGPLQNAVNAFWFSSLVFSIASTVNSLLGLTYKQVSYQSPLPHHPVPWWVLIWINRIPMAFLMVSVATFSAGLVLFTWASGQNQTTCLLTAILTGFSFFGFTTVLGWIAFEHFTHSRHKGKYWLAEVLSNYNADFRKYTGIAWAKDVLPRHTERVRSWSGTQASSVMQRSMTFLCSLGSNKHGDMSTGVEATLPVPHRVSEATSVRTDWPTSMTPPLSGPSTPPPDMAGKTEPTDGSQRPTGKRRFASAVRSVIMLQNASTSASPLTPARKLTGLSATAGSLDPIWGVIFRRARRDSTKLKHHAMLVSTLKSVETTETLQAHQALIRHLQFSPNGKWLATCSWDRTSVLFKVGNGEPFTPHRTLAHSQGFVHQVAWAPTGSHLLTKLHRGVKVWTEDGVCIKTIERHRSVQSVTWLPSGKEFLSVEGSVVNRLNLAGYVVDSYCLPRLALHDVAVAPDEERIFGVATVIESPDKLQPYKARKEKRIVVYNIAEKSIESQVPVLHNVRDITISTQGHLALVNYEDKAPPQLWRLDRVYDHVRLSLCNNYRPNYDVDFAGPSYFGGQDDQLILCAGKNGHIHIWDRDSAALLHDFRAPDGDLTGIAWNTASDTAMFATGSHDGAVRIWTPPFNEPLADDSRSQSEVQSGVDSPSSMEMGSIVMPNVAGV